MPRITQTHGHHLPRVAIEEFLLAMGVLALATFYKCRFRQAVNFFVSMNPQNLLRYGGVKLQKRCLGLLLLGTFIFYDDGI